ncbi:MAG: ATP-binding protein, partial [Fibrobacter sp.]|nr:ATP-binding protein [Fibrobacter sp.]
MRKKSFNTTGPCMADMHYMLSPVDRIDAAKLQRFIDEKLYWVLHAPRQTGKTSFLLNWMEQLNAQPGIISLYVSVETCQGFSDAETAMSLVCESIKRRAELHLPAEYWPEISE